MPRMETFDIPIIRSGYDLAAALYALRASVPKHDRYSLWQRCENLVLDVLEGILNASELPRVQKLPSLRHVSIKLNVLRLCLRLAKDARAINLKQYAAVQQRVDDIGRMLGGWIRSAGSA